VLVPIADVIESLEKTVQTLKDFDKIVRENTKKPEDGIEGKTSPSSGPDKNCPSNMA